MKKIIFAAFFLIAAKAEAVDVIGNWTFKRVDVSTITASSATLTGARIVNPILDGSCTGTACGSGGGLASTDIDTSAELAAIVTDETGSGAMCFANTPTLVTPVLGAATATSIAIGTNPGSAGALRIPNNTSITFRNAANSADFSIKLNTSNEFEIDAPLNITGTASAMLLTGVASPSAPSGSEQWYFYADSADDLPKYIYNGGSEQTFYTTANPQTTVSGNAGTATALASNPTDCSANQFANAIAASGNLTCSALADADIPDTITASNYQPLDAALTALAGGSDFVALSGPASTTKTFTLPNANSNIAVWLSSGTFALDTDAIASTACDTMTKAAAGLATTDVITWVPNADITGVTGYAPVTTGGLSIYMWPTADTINVKVCNPTASSITPGAVTLNWRVVR